ncbi:uncharacterized protein LOC134215049 isoform X2 [Armigeres subalbatus]|uniref:uncharacterized protein LOC134215049 isoform X2 n=1 Tax=Armigeres subalbatus TaxID=124917 RepID=UPI002ED06B08
MIRDDNGNASSPIEKKGVIIPLTLASYGTCSITLPLLDMSAVWALNLLSPGDLHAWVWVYLILHMFWAISSLLLITNARKKYVRYINIFLYIWIAITVVISVLDLALGIQFAVDYDTIIHALFLRPYPAPDSADQVLLMSATVSGIMLVMAFRGFIIWIANITLIVYLFTQTFTIYDYNQFRRKSGSINPAFVGQTSGTRRAPIDAYDMGQSQSQNQDDNRRPYNASVNYRRPLDRISEQPAETIVERPIQHQTPQEYSNQPRVFTPQPSTSVNRTFEPLARQPSVEREEIRPDPPKPIPPPPPPKNFNMNTVVRRDAAAAKVAQELNYRNSFNVANGNVGPSNGLRTFSAVPPSSANNEPDLPTPNYSPPMPRINPFENRPPLRSVLRNSRYQ